MTPVIVCLLLSVVLILSAARAGEARWREVSDE